MRSSTMAKRLGVAVAALVVGGCSMGGPNPAPSPESTSVIQSPAPSATETAPTKPPATRPPTDKPPADDKPTPTPTDTPTTTADPTATITLGFAGDIHFAAQLAPRLQNPKTALAPITPTLRRPDLTMVNLETAITDRGAPEPKEFHFRTSPAALDALADAGIDVATMANNHAVDYGPDGLADTLAAVDHSPIPVVGIGHDIDEAFKPAILTSHGVRVAFLAATTLPDRTAQAWAAGPDKPGVAVALLPKPELVRAVRAARAQADVVVVYLHWGGEREACPYWRQFRHAEALSAAGADIVVGSHAHVLLGGGWLHDTYIDYGLGNFVWYNQSPTTATGVLTLTVRGHHVVDDDFTPAAIGSDGLPRPLTGAARAQARKSWTQLNHCTRLSTSPPSAG